MRPTKRNAKSNRIANGLSAPTASGRGEPSSDSLTDREHYLHGIRSAIRGSLKERLEWIAETHANSAEALAEAINVLNQLPRIVCGL